MLSMMNALAFATGNAKPSDEPAALKALHNFHSIGKKGFHLVPEYVETRSLYNPEKPGIEQVTCVLISSLKCG